MLCPTLAALAMPAADPSPHDVAYYVGASIPSFLLLVAALKCWQISRRPTTNTKAALALMFMFLAWSLSGALGLWYKAQAQPHPGFAVLAAVLLLTLIIVTFVLGILGLAELRADRRSHDRRYNQGHAQGAWALALATVMLSIFSAGLYRGISRATAAASDLAYLAPEPAAPAPAQPAATQPSKSSTAPSPTTGTTAVVASANTLRFEDLNFEFDAPGRPWVRADAKRLNKDATLAFIRAVPDAYFVMIAEHVPHLPLDAESFTDRAIEQIRASVDSMDISSRTPLTVAGIKGVRLQCLARKGPARFVYVHWFGIRGDYAYHMAVFATPDNLLTVAADAADLFRRFRMLRPDEPPALADASAPAAAPLPKPAPRYTHSDRWGYSVTLPQGPWLTVPSNAQVFPEADYCVGLSPNTYLAVLPVSFPDFPLTLDPVASALYQRAQVQLDRLPGVTRTTWPCEGYAAEFSRTVGNLQFSYAARALKRGPFAYLVIAWTADPDRKASLPSYVDAVGIDQIPPAPPAAASLTPAEVRSQCNFLNDVGLHYFFAKHFDAALPLFARCVQANPDETAYIENQALALISLKRLTDARDLLDWAVHRHPAHTLFKTKLAFVQSELGNTDAALAIYKDVYATDHENDDSFRYYVALLHRLGRTDDAIAALERYLAHSKNPDIVVTYADLLGLRDRDDQAIKVLLDWQSRLPTNANIAYALAERYQHARRYSDTLDVVDRLVRTGLDNAYARQLKGRAQIGLKSYRQAKATLESSLQLDPNDQVTQQFLAQVSALLGQGDNSGIKTPVDPVPLPSDSLAATPPEPAAPPQPDCPSYYLRRLTAIAYAPGAEYRTTIYRTVKILDKRGVDAFTTLQYRFDPLAERIYLNRLEVRSPDGRVTTADVADCFVTDYADRALGTSANRSKVLNIPVPSLQPGSTLDWVLSRRDIAPDNAFRYFDDILAADTPILHGGVFVRTDHPDSIRAHPTGPVKPLPVASGLYWSADAVPPIPSEPDLPLYADFLPCLYLADASATWQSEARDYLRSISDLLNKPDPKVAAVARDLTAGLASDQDKALALARHVRTSLTYKAIEFGRHARTPAPASDALANRYGDCKDHSLLLHQLLAAAGIPSDLVLLRSDADTLADLPSLDQFNHMIVYCPTLTNPAGTHGAFLDCTNKDADLLDGLAYWPGRQVLLLDPDHPALAPVPAPRPGHVSDRRDLRILPTGDVAVTETLTCAGPPASGLRAFLRPADAAERTRALRYTVARRTGDLAAFDDPRIDHLNDPDQPLVLHFSYTVRGRFSPAGDRLVGTLPAAWERHYLEADPSPARHAPFRLYLPFTVTTDTTVTLPDGYAPDAPIPTTPRHQDDPFTTADLTTTNGPLLTLHADITAKSGSFPPADHASYERSRQQLFASLEIPLVLTKHP